MLASGHGLLLGTRVRGPYAGLVAGCSCRYFARQATREGFEMDDEILTVFERFEVVWPLDVADGINGPTSAST